MCIVDNWNWYDSFELPQLDSLRLYVNESQRRWFYMDWRSARAVAWGRRKEVIDEKLDFLVKLQTYENIKSHKIM